MNGCLYIDGDVMEKIVEDLSQEQDSIVWFVTILIFALAVRKQRTGR
jgi:hypothetical protein